jgi:hypothetical protein
LLVAPVATAEMGFGSYDESEQEKHDIGSDLDEDASVATNSQGHDGAVDYEFSASNDELLDQLEDIKKE